MSDGRPSAALQWSGEEVAQIRVGVGSFERLINIVGQLVIDRTRIERRVEQLRALTRDLQLSRRVLRGAIEDLHDTEQQSAVSRLAEIDLEIADTAIGLERALTALGEDTEAVRRTVRGLERSLTRMRMMPIRWLYARLQRPLEDLGRSEGKKLQLVTEGEATEIDRTIVEKITDPLIHLIRNAVAHGIEQPEERRRAGKPEVGTIRVSARHLGDMLTLEVGDDGAGIDTDRLRAEAQAQGWRIAAAEHSSDGAEVIQDIIFSSGFSTRKQVDTLAGRGVGLDVVRRSIAALGGDIRVTSKAGRGTTFSVQLPLTSAVSQSLLFEIRDEIYGVPVAHVVGVANVGHEALQADADGFLTVETRYGRLPVLDWGNVVGGGAERSAPAEGGAARRLFLVLSSGNMRFALGCKRLVGPRQVVVKKLGRALSPISLFSGATVSGSGKVQLLLDVAVLADLVRQGYRQRTGLHPRVGRKRVLVADDSRAVREALAIVLRGAGFSVDLVVDGWDAAQRLTEFSYDALVTDLEMPRLDGYDLIRRIRARAEYRELPIVVVTSRTSSDNRSRARSAGANAFIAKPINRRNVLECLEDLLEKNAKPVKDRLA